MESCVNAYARYKEIEEKVTKLGIILQGSFKIAGVGSTLRSVRFDACEPHILYNTKTQSVLYIHIDPETDSAQLYERTIENLRSDYKKTGVKYSDQDEAAKKFFAEGDIFHFQIIYTYEGVTVSNSKPHTNDEIRVRKLLTCLNPINATEHKEVPTCSRKITTRQIYVGQNCETQLGSLAVNITTTGLEFHAWINGDIGEPAPTDAGVLHAEARKAGVGSRTYQAFIRQINISSDGKNVSQMTTEGKLEPVPLSYNAQKEQFVVNLNDSVQLAKTAIESTPNAATVAPSQGSSASPDGLFGFQQRATEQAIRQKTQRTTPSKEESAQEIVKRRC